MTTADFTKRCAEMAVEAVRRESWLGRGVDFETQMLEPGARGIKNPNVVFVMHFELKNVFGIESMGGLACNVEVVKGMKPEQVVRKMVNAWRPVIDRARKAGRNEVAGGIVLP
jgi:hypothetical protein